MEKTNISLLQHSSMSEKIILIGASDHCKYTIDIIEQENKYEIYGILDKALRPGEEFGGYPILGYLEKLEELLQEGIVAGGVVAIGDNYSRQQLVKQILAIKEDFNFVTAIHPSVLLGKDASLGKGCVIMAGVIINNNCIVENHCFLATKSSLDHDSFMEQFSSLSPGVTTGGRVRIGYCSAIGIGASILHYRKVGQFCVIGGNSLVNKDIEDFSVAFGTPARIMRKRKPEEKYL